MHNVTPRDTGFRAYHGAARGTIDKVDDSHLMQTADAGFMRSDARTGIERWQDYGITSVPLPRDSGSGTAKKTGGEGDLGPANKGKAAEVLMVFPGGNRSHPIAARVDDRRHRLQQLKPGEVALYDDQTQQVHLARAGIYVSVPDGKTFQVRVQKAGDKVKPAGGSTGAGSGGATSAGGPGQYGQTAWLPKAPYADHTIDKNARTVRHPKTVQHQVVQENDIAKVLHLTQLTKANGLLHSIGEGNHLLKMLPTGGISLESVMKVAHKAPDILHDGPTRLLKTLSVLEGVTAAGFTVSSSRAIKENIGPPRFGLAALLRLKVVEYNLRADAAKRPTLGLIAQQVRRHFPLAVTLVKGALRRRLTIDQGQMIALLVRSVQEQQAEIAALQRDLVKLRKLANR